MPVQQKILKMSGWDLLVLSRESGVSVEGVGGENFLGKKPKEGSFDI
jgi:hypothetical protein